MLRRFLVALAVLSVFGLMTTQTTEGLIRFLVPFALMGVLLRLRSGGRRYARSGQ